MLNWLDYPITRLSWSSKKFFLSNSYDIELSVLSIGGACNKEREESMVPLKPETGLVGAISLESSLDSA